MAFEYLAWDLQLHEERDRRYDLRYERRILRDHQNPYALDPEVFVRSFRVSQHLAMDIANELRPHLQRSRCNGLSPELQVLVAIQFYAQGSYQRGVGYKYDFNLSQPSVSRCITDVTTGINRLLLRRWIRFPMTTEEKEAAKRKFAIAPQPFKGAIGAIDCTYINILAPSGHEEAYVNHHGNHSLNVQAIVDPNLRILNINAKFPGARNDAFIWSTSPIRGVMEDNFNRGERRTWLIGDAGYPLEPWLMTPLLNYPENTRQFQYTWQLCKARNAVERFFGVLKVTWRCLSYLLYNPTKAGMIVNACAVLHNMRLDYRVPEDDTSSSNLQLVASDPPHITGHITPTGRGGAGALGSRIQRQIMQERFPTFPDGDRNDN